MRLFPKTPTRFASHFQVPTSLSRSFVAMASRFSPISRPAASFIKHAAKKPNRPVSSIPLSSFPRVPRELGSLQSLLPFHSAVSSARLTSRLGINSARSLSSLYLACPHVPP